jgi:hypothetical protein
MRIKNIFLICLLAKILMNVVAIESFELIYAINAGGDQHTDIDGIHYSKDNTNGGWANLHTRNDTEKNYYNVPTKDEIMYHTAMVVREPSFGFDLPVKGDGKYWLLLKFMEKCNSTKTNRRTLDRNDDFLDMSVCDRSYLSYISKILCVC